jgi:hypothetical protein
MHTGRIIDGDHCGSFALHDWKHTLREGLVGGTLAGLMSAAVLLVAAKRDAGSAVAAVNAESHWLWGDEALNADSPTLRHTLTGIVTHQLSTVFWATLHALARGGRKPAKRVPRAVLGGIATSAAAAAIDYTLVPRRLRPGFEHRLSTGSMVAVFAAIAGGMAIGTLLARDG